MNRNSAYNAKSLNVENQMSGVHTGCVSVQQITISVQLAHRAGTFVVGAVVAGRVSGNEQMLGDGVDRNTVGVLNDIESATLHDSTRLSVVVVVGVHGFVG